VCTCEISDTCPGSTTTGTGCAVGHYAIAKDSGFICVKFGSGAGSKVDVDSPTTLVEITDDLLTVTIDGTEETYSVGAAATSDNGNKLHALVLISNDDGVFFSECGPFIVESDQQPEPARKRAPEIEELSFGSGSFVSAATASGDPHLAGANGVTFDVYGKPAANYSLLVAPAFEVNMQLADRGPRCAS
jgi:hypothetical protein